MHRVLHLIPLYHKGPCECKWRFNCKSLVHTRWTHPLPWFYCFNYLLWNRTHVINTPCNPSNCVICQYIYEFSSMVHDLRTIFHLQNVVPCMITSSSIVNQSGVKDQLKGGWCWWQEWILFKNSSRTAHYESNSQHNTRTECWHNLLIQQFFLQHLILLIVFLTFFKNMYCAYLDL